MRNPFDEVFAQEGADKQSTLHGYDAFYCKVLVNWTAHPIALLEIGIYQGASVRSWLRLFPNARITGIDLDPYLNPDPRYVHYQGDATSHHFLTRVANERGPFNVIIDDGNHMNEAQAFAFFTLWPFVSTGGLYVIEDIQPWFDEEQDKAYNGHWPALLKAVLSDLNHRGKDYYGRRVQLPGFSSEIRSVAFEKGLMAVFKK